MKLINYKDTVSFRLPKDWIENYNDDEATFYQDSDNSGTMRLKIITPTTNAEQADGSIPICSDSSIYVEEGFPLTEEVKYISEDGDNFLSYYWYVFINGNNTSKILIFSYTILVSQQNDPIILSEVNLVRNTIISAQYK